MQHRNNQLNSICAEHLSQHMLLSTLLLNFGVLAHCGPLVGHCLRDQGNLEMRVVDKRVTSGGEGVRRWGGGRRVHRSDRGMEVSEEEKVLHPPGGRC